MGKTISDGSIGSGAVVCDYMHAAISEIDDFFGSGFARNNPALLAGFIQAMAIEREGSGIRDLMEIRNAQLGGK